MPFGAHWAKVLCALNTVHGCVSFLAEIACHLAARELSLLSAGSDKGVDEGAANKGTHSIVRGGREWCLANMTLKAHRELHI